MQLLRATLADPPALDIALSHALLRRVAAGDREPCARLYRPVPTLAFGRLDALGPGFAQACAAAREHGFEPVVRLCGGRAVAYHPGCLIYETIVAQTSVAEGIRERFATAAQRLRGALAGLGVEAAIGELPGEYCPGAFTVSVAGRLKVAGAAQRSIRGAALLSAVVVVTGGDAIRAALVDANAALGVEWDPATAGALDDAVSGIEPAAIGEAFLRAHPHPFEEATAEVEVLAQARELVALHRVA